jgi:hypothetical protein
VVWARSRWAKKRGGGAARETPPLQEGKAGRGVKYKKYKKDFTQ